MYHTLLIDVVYYARAIVTRFPMMRSHYCIQFLRAAVMRLELPEQANFVPKKKTFRKIILK